MPALSKPGKLQSTNVGAHAMSDLLKEITSCATALSPEERAQLAEVMLESLQEGTSTEVDAVGSRAATRIAVYDRGESKLVSAKDVFDEARRLTT